MSQTPPPSNEPDPAPGSSGSPGSQDASGSTQPSQGGSTPSGASPGRQGKTGGKDPLRRSRAGRFYGAVVGLGVVLALLTIFIVQNTDTTTVNFLGLQAEAPVAVLLLIAAAAGILLAGVAASLRIMQLRRRFKHDRRS